MMDVIAVVNPKSKKRNILFNPPIDLIEHYRVFYVIIDDFIYFLAYRVDLSRDILGAILPPNNFDIYYTNKVKNMVDSICFPINSQANKQCPSTFPTTPLNPPPGPIVTEEWRNYDYKEEIPSKPDFYKVVITCINQQGGNCLEQPGKITFV